MIGKRLAHYEITALLGKGGMGEVYRARDTRLDRDVALKVLPGEVTDDVERCARFEREAKLLAALSHPNIAAIYGLEEAEGRAFLCMELAEGEDLSRRLERGAIPVGEALDLARQIASGLEAAHAKGIVHRDLKPANVMVSADGRVKLLDFGLARAFQGEEASGDPRESPTLTAAMTRQGVILGTAAYMSPEQARGRSVDRQTDVWSFGAVLYEMLTAHRPFAGETVSDSIAAILGGGPDWSLLPPGTPRRVRRLLRRCLQRDRAARLRDIGDALVELDDDAETGEPADVPSRVARSGPRRALPWIVAALAAAVATAVLLIRPGGNGDLPLRKLTILPITETDEVSGVLLSPDGKRVAYRSGGVMWVRDLDESTPRRVSNATGFSSWVTIWSPDSQWLAFADAGDLRKVAMDGSAPLTICEIPTEDRFIAGAWDSRDHIVLAKWRGGLLEVSANGGTIRDLMPAPEDLVDYHTLEVLPDGSSLLASAHLAGETGRIDVIRDGRIVRSVQLSGRVADNATYSTSGHIVYWEDRKGIWAVPFSLDRLEKTGEPFVIDPDGASPSCARDGSLVYERNVQHTPGRLVSVDTSGEVTGTLGDPGEDLGHPLLSPSGDVLAYAANVKGEWKLWTLDLGNGATRRVTRLEGDETACSWSADGRELLLFRELNWSSPDNGLYLVDLDTGAPVHIGDGRKGQLLPDGDGVLYWKFDIRNHDRLEWKAFGDDATPHGFVGSMQRALYPALSPDGRLVAFESDDSGEQEVWFAPFPGGENRLQVSRGGGHEPVWSRDGRHLFFLSSGALYRVSVSSGKAPRYGVTEKLFDGASGRLDLDAGYDVLPDGTGFVMIRRLPLEDASLVHVQHWVAEFPGR
jgi:serine/threonine protein kinase